MKLTHVIYTDGSKNSQGCGAAVVIRDRVYKFSLPPISSVYLAEMYAIYKALVTVGGIVGNIAICSDSTSSLLSLRQMYSKHPIVQNIHASLYNLRQEGTNVIFVWIPGHSGIMGNETADVAAKAAANMESTVQRHLPVDVIREIKIKVLQGWQDEWTSVTANKLREIKDIVTPWDSSYRGNRREEVVLARLRIGHTRLTHGYLMNRDAAPICSSCDVPLTVKHIMLDCSRYNRSRVSSHIPGRIEDALGNDQSTIDRVIKYLQDIHIYNYI
ncbi:uncharacterized protein [Rhodnius prolixus]|uniref:uncharacterized protein n=1 Tax=Rhodnius prolixus TaxID=13249 RepID=UPI003D1891A0